MRDRGRIMSGGMACVLGLVLVLAWGGRAGAQEGAVSPRAESDRSIPPGLLENEVNTITVFREASPSVVHITNSRLQRDFFSLNVTRVPRGTGSGFVWDKRGHIVTNYHVIQGGNAFTVTLADGTTYDATYVGGDPNKDLAVLKIEASRESLVPVVLGDADALVVGQKVLAIGNPFGLDRTLTTGVISALGREIQSVTGTTIQGVIQTDASINPGNSGGPLLDSAGRLIGVNASIVSPSGASAGIGFAVPVNIVLRVVPQLVRFGHVKRAGLGIRYADDQIAWRLRIRGVIVRAVEPGGPAESAGIRSPRYDRSGRLRSLDIIVAVDGKPVTRTAELYDALDAHEPGDRVTVRVHRGDREFDVKVRLKVEG